MRGNKSKGLVVVGMLVGLLAGALPSRAMDLKLALGQIESGAINPTRCAADCKVGSRREVSRYQILPSVWRKYSSSRDYQDPAVAWEVTQRILIERYTLFRAATGREWNALDLYIMWNAPGVYEKANWDAHKVSRIVLERAERFANLYHSEDKIMVRASLD